MENYPVCPYKYYYNTIFLHSVNLYTNYPFNNSFSCNIELYFPYWFWEESVFNILFLLFEVSSKSVQFWWCLADHFIIDKFRNQSKYKRHNLLGITTMFTLRKKVNFLFKSYLLNIVCVWKYMPCFYLLILRFNCILYRTFEGYFLLQTNYWKGIGKTQSFIS